MPPVQKHFSPNHPFWAQKWISLQALSFNYHLRKWTDTTDDPFKTSCSLPPAPILHLCPIPIIKCYIANVYFIGWPWRMSLWYCAGIIRLHISWKANKQRNVYEMESGSFNSFMAFFFFLSPPPSPFAGRIVVLSQELENNKKGDVVIEPPAIKSHLPCCWTPSNKMNPGNNEVFLLGEDNCFEWINS